MKPDHIERNHALAAEYVVGTLQGKARLRFERWMMDSSKLRRQVWFWERRLQPFNESFAAVPPPKDVWQTVEKRLFPDAVEQPETMWDPVSMWDKVRLWRWTTAMATAALMVMLVWAPTAPEQTAYLGVVQNQQAEPVWLVNTSAREHQLTLKALPAVSNVGLDQDYELWLLPSSGAPVSLAIMPTGGAELRIQLSNDQVRELIESRSLAISLEPKGGSPTGQPTGPVVYQTRLIEL
ncbi:MAG: anti-sigma factor [Alcanivoracaceae bacterium]|nr:anti-sigma factor [Alcanivoracaceae bacterium]